MAYLIHNYSNSLHIVSVNFTELISILKITPMWRRNRLVINYEWRLCDTNCNPLHAVKAWCRHSGWIYVLACFVYRWFIGTCILIRLIITRMFVSIYMHTYGKSSHRLRGGSLFRRYKTPLDGCICRPPKQQYCPEGQSQALPCT